MTNAVGWMLPKAPLLPQAGQPAAQRGQTLTATSFATEPPEIQALLLSTISNHYPPKECLPQVESLAASATDAWPKFVAACITPSPCAELKATQRLLRQLKSTDEDALELKPEPSRWISYKPPPPGYKTKLREVRPLRQSSTTALAAPTAPRRTAAVNEFVRLGTGMQPTLSRRKSNITAANLPRVKSLFLSGRKSGKARAAEEKARAEEPRAPEETAREENEREEQEKGDEEREHQQAEADVTNLGANTGGNAENGGGNQDEIQQNEYMDFSDYSDLDVTVRDAAEIERTEGMDENMIQSQRDKEARPRHVGAILKKMHGRNAGQRNIVAEQIDLPAPTDTEYARLRRKEEADKRRSLQAEATREKERQMREQRRLRFVRKRKRKLQKAGKVVRTDSEDDQTSVAPEEDSTTAENSAHPMDTYKRDSAPRDAQRRRVEPPKGYEDRREGDNRYPERSQEGANPASRYDDPGRYNYPQPPPDTRRYGERPPQWQHAFPYHPSATPPNYGPPPYYTPPSPYYGYHPPPYYPHHASPPPPHQQYYPPRAPPRLSREEFEKKRKDLYNEIGRNCRHLHADDSRAIDDFLDNQDHMFRANEKAKYYLLEQTDREEVLLRIDKETHAWEVVRKQASS